MCVHMYVYMLMYQSVRSLTSTSNNGNRFVKSINLHEVQEHLIEIDESLTKV